MVKAPCGTLIEAVVTRSGATIDKFIKDILDEVHTKVNTHQRFIVALAVEYTTEESKFGLRWAIVI